MTTRQELLEHHATDMTYAGELSFLRRLMTQNITQADVVVTGIPFDAATTYRPGARLGPQAIRAASVQLAELAQNAFPDNIDLFSTLAIADYGDCELRSGELANVVDIITDHARNILKQAPFLISMGGDHFVTYPLLIAHVEKHGPLSLLHFDAHVDTWPDDAKRLDHGSMFLRALKEGLIDPERSVQVGIRSFSESDYGFRVIEAPWVHEQGVRATVDEIKRVLGDHATYLTFDIDCLDPAYAPGTGTPVAGGLTSAQALGIVRSLDGIDFVGMDMVEVAPAYDHAEITSIVAANIIHDFLLVLARNKRGDRG
ncbi:MAG: agmatinase [Pseudomonadales bacterium]|nr:agmatinase [Pseudomonadales bacterium]MBO6655335.1 agmatinase [Pseudomonadales bacterium]MBO6703789.1 agmatinase [Pseudomonadales bacterium]MBO7005164.1 agmatinase [Pseudomonadales bacterium]